MGAAIVDMAIAAPYETAGQKRKTNMGKKTKALSSVAIAGAITAALANFPTDKHGAPKIYPGPYFAELVRVIDSDTQEYRVHVFPQQTIRVSVRTYGIDTPEKFRPQCEVEKFKAIDATTFVRSLLAQKDHINLTNIRLGKYAGRVVATVNFENETGPGHDTLAAALTRRGYAVSYFGGTKTETWGCPQEETQ